MVRPRLCRRVRFSPRSDYFKPRGIPLRELQEVVLTVDELESLRLHDLESLSQEECAKKMNISQSTFNRLVIVARKKMTEAIVKGKSLKIEGGNYKR